MKLTTALLLAFIVFSQIACVAANSESNSLDKPSAPTKAPTHNMEASLSDWLQNGHPPSDLPVQLDIQTSGLKAINEQAIKDTGASILGFYPKYERISATANTPQVIEQIIQLPFVRHIALEHGAQQKGTKPASRKPQ